MQIIPFTVNDGTVTGKQVSSFMLVDNGSIVETLPYFLFTNRSPQGVAELIQKAISRHLEVKADTKAKTKKHDR